MKATVRQLAGRKLEVASDTAGVTVTLRAGFGPHKGFVIAHGRGATEGLALHALVDALDELRAAVWREAERVRLAEEASED